MIAHALRACTVALLLSLSIFVAGPARAQADAARAAYDSENYVAAAALYLPRAKSGDAGAQYRMGMMARFGWGMDKDSEAAARWLRQAAEQNYAQAQAELGTMYRLGRGVPEDAREAARWLRAAAAQGVGIAQLSIGRMYRDGIGVSRDPVEAYAWFTAAGENNVMDGLAYRGEMARQMTEDQIAKAKQLAAQIARKEPEAK